MKIAIDLDKTIFNCDSLVYKIANFLQPLKNPSKRLSFSMIHSGIVPVSVVKTFGKVSNIRFYKSIQNANEIIKKWKEIEKHQIVLLSSRPNLAVLRNVLLMLLEKYNIDYSMLVVACNNKAEFCRVFHVDLIVDDSLTNCKSCENRGIKAIWFSEKATDRQREKVRNEGIYVARTWNEIDRIVSGGSIAKHSSVNEKAVINI